MGWDFKEKFSFLISPNQRAESETKDERVKQRKKGTHNTTQFNKKQHRRSKNKTALYQIISLFSHHRRYNFQIRLQHFSLCKT
jgi:hypothetical protein